MKNILAKIGSKQIAGAVLVVITLFVGMGVINNFSGGSQKAANEAALSRFGDSTYSDSNAFFGSSVSRAALERQMYAQQDSNTARFMQGKSEEGYEDEAISSDGAYAEGMRSDEGFVYDSSYQGGQYVQGGNYDPSNPMYAQGGVDANGVPYGAQGYMQGGAYGAGVEGDEEGAQGRAGKSKSTKGNKGQRSAGQVRQTTINKLSPSTSGASSWGSGSGSSSSSVSFVGSSQDSNTRALPQNNTPEQAKQGDGDSFKFGRSGAMGGYNVARAGGKIENGKGGNSRGAAGDLQMAAIYSGKAIASKAEAGAKQLAAAAFDGSNPESIGSTIESGASIATVANQLMDASSNSSLPHALSVAIPEVMNDIQRQQEELVKLQNKLSSKYLTLLLGTLGFFAAIAILSKGGMYAKIAAGVLTAGALVFIAAMFADGANGIMSLIDQMGSDKLKDVNQNIDLSGKKFKAIAALVASVAIIGLAWTNAVHKLVDQVKDFFKNIGQRIKDIKNAPQEVKKMAQGVKKMGMRI